MLKGRKLCIYHDRSDHILKVVKAAFFLCVQQVKRIAISRKPCYTNKNRYDESIACIGYCAMSDGDLQGFDKENVECHVLDIEES